MLSSTSFSSVQTYPTANDYWGIASPSSIYIYDITGQLLITIPCEFMRRGSVESWRYVSEMILACVEEEGGLRNEAGVVVDEGAAITAGRYTYVRKDSAESPCKFRRGPEGKTKGKAPASGASSSTYSNSKRSSNNQNKLRDLLIYRDGDCLFTGESFQACTAAHIVPLSRADLYPLILTQPVSYLFHAHMGLLLRDDIHHAYDRFEWSLYCQDENYVIHYFVPSSATQQQAHGTVITPDRFRGPKSLRPHAKLLDWHYAQLVDLFVWTL
ncbi:MAG: hypothetical protein CYPHOPRED_003186 [Cyphobasidiales sp. Tagirdzhanova-0007]|nr:MAG: hypothetical protein CYPHOPRED_003186 [Cyphobasidiales sp. Tagirdzhanova-0007]